MGGAPSDLQERTAIARFLLGRDGEAPALAPALGVAAPPAAVPVKDLFRQLIEEVGPAVVLTVGTAGGVAPDQGLGDVVVTRGAKFRLASEFRNEPFNGKQYRSDWPIPTGHFPQAAQLMA